MRSAERLDIDIANDIVVRVPVGEHVLIALLIEVVVSGGTLFAEPGRSSHRRRAIVLIDV